MTTAQKIALGVALAGGTYLAYRYVKNRGQASADSTAASVAAGQTPRKETGDLSVRQPGGSELIDPFTGQNKQPVYQDGDTIQIGPVRISEKLSN